MLPRELGARERGVRTYVTKECSLTSQYENFDKSVFIDMKAM
jgi:hypothetical protein